MLALHDNLSAAREVARVKQTHELQSRQLHLKSSGEKETRRMEELRAQMSTQREEEVKARAEKLAVIEGLRNIDNDRLNSMEKIKQKELAQMREQMEEMKRQEEAKLAEIEKIDSTVEPPACMKCGHMLHAEPNC